MEANYFTILYWFCHTSTWIRHRRTCVPHPEPPLPLPSPYNPSGSSQCTSPKHPVSNLNWQFVSYMDLLKHSGLISFCFLNPATLHNMLSIQNTDLFPFRYWLVEDVGTILYLVGLVTQSCPTLCNPMDCSPPGSSVRVILQERILEWVAIPFSRECSWPKVRTWVSCLAGRFFTIWITGEAHFIATWF